MRNLCLGLYALFTSWVMAPIWVFAEGPISIIVSPSPQAKHNTCQSYALAYALSSVSGSQYNIQTAAQLRVLELDLRNKINSIAKNRGKSPLNHSVWTEAVEAYTSNKFRLVRKEFPDIISLMGKAAEITGVSNAETLGPVFASIAVKKPVLTSVTAIDGDTYDGHIISILGISGGGMNSQARILALNPAIKTPSTYKNACDPGDMPGDYKYSAAATLTSHFTLKPFDGKFMLMWVE